MPLPALPPPPSQLGGFLAGTYRPERLFVGIGALDGQGSPFVGWRGSFFDPLSRRGRSPPRSQRGRHGAGVSPPS